MRICVQWWVLFLVCACGGSEDASSNGVPESDPAVLATYQPWERECILWIRSDCKKAEACHIRPASNCWDSDEESRVACQAMVAEESCQAPDPASFERCRSRTEGETCQEYCDSSFCFNFCFFSCLD